MTYMRNELINELYEDVEVDEFFDEREFYEDLMMEQKEQM